MFRREIDGLLLTFHLAGINNQNFLMRDEETGTYWQQISGMAVAGALKGRQLKLIPADELTFALWKTEQPAGTVLQDATQYASGYAPPNWDEKMQKTPTVLSYPESGLKPRDLMLGIHAFGASRAFPYEAVRQQKLIQNHVGTEPVILVVGPDGESMRAFRQKIPGVAETPEFYRMQNGSFLMDSATGANWNFQGCATSGKLQGVCLERVDVIKDYWFDWRNYNADTSVYR